MVRMWQSHVEEIQPSAVYIHDHLVLPCFRHWCVVDDRDLGRVGVGFDDSCAHC